MATYNLLAGDGEFYPDIADFADCVLEYGEKYRSIINLYSTWAVEVGRARTDLEYILEYLSLGVYWRVFGSRAAAGFFSGTGLLTALARCRRRGGAAKVICDKVRGILLTLFLRKRKAVELSMDPDGLRSLITWLQATGEFNLESRRLEELLGWLQTLPRSQAGTVLIAATEYAAWFEGESQLALGKYTQGVEGFLRDELPKRMWQEDIILCGRKPVEYHLNMVGSEILNWAYRRDFQKVENYVVLAPRCMCKAGSKCPATATEHGYRCACCTRDCQISILTELGLKQGFEVYLIPHESNSFARWQGSASRKEGVIGIACATRLIEGGLKARSLGLPAQCVLLDSCGCRHWREVEVVTSISMERLLEVMDQDWVGDKEQTQ